jgi:hypothetical protein
MTQTKTRYSLTVWVDLPNDDDGTPEMTKTEVEHMVNKIVGRHFDCDCEVMDTEVLEDA